MSGDTAVRSRNYSSFDLVEESEGRIDNTDDLSVNLVYRPHSTVQRTGDSRSATYFNDSIEYSIIEQSNSRNEVLNDLEVNAIPSSVFDANIMSGNVMNQLKKSDLLKQNSVVDRNKDQEMTAVMTEAAADEVDTRNVTAAVNDVGRGEYKQLTSLTIDEVAYLIAKLIGRPANAASISLVLRKRITGEWLNVLRSEEDVENLFEELLPFCVSRILFSRISSQYRKEGVPFVHFSPQQEEEEEKEVEKIEEEEEEKQESLLHDLESSSSIAAAPHVSTILQSTPAEPVSCLVVIGSIIVSGENTYVLIRNGDAVAKFISFGRKVCFLLALDGQNILAGLDNGNIWKINIINDSIRTWTGHVDGSVIGLALLTDGQTIISASAKSLMLWRSSDGICFGTLTDKRSEGMRCLASLPLSPASDHQRVVVGTNNKTLVIWDLTDKTIVKVLLGQHKGHVCCVTCPSHDTIVSGGGDKDKTVYVWNVIDGTLKGTYKHHKYGVYSLLALPNDIMASGSADNTIVLWRLNNKNKQKKVLREHGDRITCLSVLVDGRLASGSKDTTIRIWDREATNMDG